MTRKHTNRIVNSSRRHCLLSVKGRVGDAALLDTEGQFGHVGSSRTSAESKMGLDRHADQQSARNRAGLRGDFGQQARRHCCYTFKNHDETLIFSSVVMGAE
jgi:hypothetical protein